MRAGKLFTVVEDDSVGQALADASAVSGNSGYERLERVFDALVWRLAREPKCGTASVDTSGTEYRYVKARPVSGAKNPTILVRYIVDEQSESIFIDRIKVYPYDASEAASLREFHV